MYVPCCRGHAIGTWDFPLPSSSPGFLLPPSMSRGERLDAKGPGGLQGREKGSPSPAQVQWHDGTGRPGHADLWGPGGDTRLASWSGPLRPGTPANRGVNSCECGRPVGTVGRHATRSVLEASAERGWQTLQCEVRVLSVSV